MFKTHARPKPFYAKPEAAAAHGSCEKYRQGVLTATVNTFLELARKNARSNEWRDCAPAGSAETPPGSATWLKYQFFH